MKRVVCWILTFICGFLTLVVISMLNDPFISEDSTAFGTTVFFAVVLGIATAMSIKGAVSNPKKAKKKKSQPEEEIRNARIAEVAAVSVLPVVDSDSVAAILLHPGETCHYQVPASIVEIKEQVVGYSGGNGGVSVRVARGLTLHSGSSRRTPIRADVVKKYPGIFTMTNERMIMTGEKGFEHPLNKLTAMIPWNEFAGIMLQFGRSSYTVEMEESYWIPKIIDLLNEQKLANHNK